MDRAAYAVSQGFTILTSRIPRSNCPVNRRLGRWRRCFGNRARSGLPLASMKGIKHPARQQRPKPACPMICMAFLPWWLGYVALGIPLALLGVVLLIAFVHHRGERPFPPGCCRMCGTRFLSERPDNCPRCGWLRRRCVVCRYDLTGNISGACPECGETIRENPP